jgi:hypothetical protein
MAILAETCSVLRTFKSFKHFKCECEELTSVCTQDGELIVIQRKVQQDATIYIIFTIQVMQEIKSYIYIGL